MSVVQKKEKDSTDKWFLFVLIFLVIDYGRPQDILPIAFIRPAFLVMLVLIFYILSNRGIIKSKSNQVVYIWLFIALLAMQIPFSHNNFWAYRIALSILTMMPFIISVVAVIDRIERLKKFLFVFTCIVLYISLYSLTHHGMGSGNFLADENDVSLVIVMWLPFNYFLFFHEKEKFRKMVYLAGGILGLMAVVASFSRGGFVGLLVAGFVIWLVSHKKVITLFVIGIVAAGFVTLSSDQYLQEMSTVTDTEESTASARLALWATAWDMFLDNPLGVGGNNYRILIVQYQGDRFSRDMGGTEAHSLWFTLLAEAGIIGTFLYFRLILFNIVDIKKIRAKKDETNEDLRYMHAVSLSLMASMAGFFASASFISVLYYPHFWYMCGLIAAIRNVHGNIEKNRENTGEVKDEKYPAFRKGGSGIGRKSMKGI